jgi:signal transduction histidine kinase
MKARQVVRSASLVALVVTPSITWPQEPSLAVKNVLMLYGHDRNAPGAIVFTKELHAVVQAGSPTRVVFYDELLDLGRFPENAHREELLGVIVKKYRGLHFDAIVTDGSRALQFATERVMARFPNVPVVYAVAFEPILDFNALPANVTGIRDLIPHIQTFALARALQPHADTLVIVAGSSPNDSVILAAAVRDLTPHIDGMQLVVWRDWTYGSLLQRMRTLSPHDITILSAFTRDRAGQEFNAGDIIASLTRRASGPVYGIARNWVGDGIVGGVTMDFADDGARTGRLLLRVLGRASPELPLPPPEFASPASVVDWRELQHWRLPESRLPAGTQVVFRTPTVWERFHTLFLCVAALVAAQSTLIVLLLVERRKRLRAVRLVEESRTQLAHIGRVATLGELTAAISHELRQPLSAIRANAEAGAMLLDQTPSDLGEAREAFGDIARDDRRAVEVLDRIRMLVRKDEPIATSVDLNELCEWCSELLMSDAVQRGVDLRLSLEPGLPRIIGDPVQLQQVVLNLALNGFDAVEGSPPPREVVLGTSVKGADVAEIYVRDTGPGLSPEAQLHAFDAFFSTKSKGLGMGLAIVRSIVERHHGRVQAENERTGGAIFRVQLPVTSDALGERARRATTEYKSELPERRADAT